MLLSPDGEFATEPMLGRGERGGHVTPGDPPRRADELLPGDRPLDREDGRWITTRDCMSKWTDSSFMRRFCVP